jgi:integrase
MASILPIGEKWRALVRRKGHKPICKTHSTKAAAEAWARKIEHQLDEGKPVAVDGLTVGQLIQIYRDLRDKGRPILDTSNEHYMLEHLTEGLGTIKATLLSIDDLLGWAQKRADEGAGPYTVNMELSKLGTALRFAGAAKRQALPDVVGTARPVLAHMGLIGGGGKRKRRVTEDELVRIMAELQQPYSDAVLFAVLSTLRRSEICRIVWSEVDHSKRMVLVRDRKHPRKKQGNDEWVPLRADAWAVLKRQPVTDDPRVFPIHPQTISKYFKAACDKHGIVDLHLHDMRHEGTSRLFEAGYTIEEAALFTGHKTWKELQRYTQLDPTKVRKD